MLGLGEESSQPETHSVSENYYTTTQQIFPLLQRFPGYHDAAIAAFESSKYYVSFHVGKIEFRISNQLGCLTMTTEKVLDHIDDNDILEVWTVNVDHKTKVSHDKRLRPSLLPDGSVFFSNNIVDNLAEDVSDGDLFESFLEYLNGLSQQQSRRVS